jgi:hypothetical protein
MKKMMMIAAMMVATLSANAQRSILEPGQFGLQPKVGVNLGTVSADDTKFKFGLVAGFEGQYQVNNWFGLSLGILYSQQGSKFKVSDDVKLNTEYINIPVMAKFYVAKGLSLNVGLQPGFLTKSKFNVGSDLMYLYDLKLEGDADIKDFTNKFDLSIPMSIAYEFDFGLALEARYTGGLTNVMKNAFDRNASTYDKTYKNKNEVFSLTVGYKFGF